MSRDALKKKMKTATLQEKSDVGSPKLSIFKFVLPDSFVFEPGQYATLALDTPSGFLPRPYSIASSPHQDKQLEFYINVVDEGEFTPHLFRLRAGDSVWYMGPKGKFTLAQTRQKNLFLVSTGTGLAPFVSMLRKMDFEMGKNGRSDYNVVLMHGVSYTSDLGYRKEIEAWSQRPDLDVIYIPTVSRPDKDPEFEQGMGQGRVNDVFRALIGEPKTGSVDPKAGEKVDIDRVIGYFTEGAAFYLCGNPGMIADLKEVLIKHGHTEIYTEDYW